MTNNVFIGAPGKQMLEKGDRFPESLFQEKPSTEIRGKSRGKGTSGAMGVGGQNLMVCDRYALYFIVIS
ncbi:hypothetical protein GF1_14700 [Desulfolithobacter dissulfuricans]|uniref:Uncharacterized protein n=1 Tax=Desulfolithobacter dissulfuricans TaxID=2795293 RepID=A0A915XHV1_9BACT|nr:hypothetical protein GF1_14700 [Desulfolithobacter dissulfuricans]